MHAHNTSQVPGHELYAAWGATAYITNTSSQLQSSHAYTSEDTVLVGNGDYLPITHVGTAVLPSLQGKLLLKDVLVFAPLSITLCYQFQNLLLITLVPLSSILIVLLWRTNRQGSFSPRVVDRKIFTYWRTCSSWIYSHRQQATTGDVWHMSLGYPHRDVLQRLSRNKAIVLNKSSSQLCEACQLGKSSRLLFSFSDFSKDIY